MNIAVGIGLFVVVAIAAIIVVTFLALQQPKSTLPPELNAKRDRLRAAVEAIIARVPARPSPMTHAVPAHPRAGAVEAKLLAKNPRSALVEAERVIAEDSSNPDAHVLLARALVHADELEAAADEIGRARQMGASGAMLDYLEGRVSHSLIVKKTNAASTEVQDTAVPSMITPFELLVLQLERQRRISDKAAAVWLASLGNQTLGHDQILDLVVAHFSAYYTSLEKMCAAADKEPGFAEALYHVARLALKVGFIDQGRRLFEAIEPLMDSTPEAFYYERDLAQLRDENEPVAWLPTVKAGRRQIKLKVLD